MNIKIDNRLWQTDIDKIHTSFKTHLYQFLENDSYNETYFKEVEKEATEAIYEFFSGNSSIVMIINQSVVATKPYRPLTKRIVHNVSSVRLSSQEYSFMSDGEFVRINQLILKTRGDNIRWKQLIQSIMHEDFPDRKPRFPCSINQIYPDVYFFNQETGQLLHMYDDRGYEVYKPDFFTTFDNYIKI